MKQCLKHTVHLKKSINVSNGRNVLRDKRTQLSFQLNGLRCVASDVMKELLQFTAHLQVVIIRGVIYPTNVKKREQVANVCAFC